MWARSLTVRSVLAIGLLFAFYAVALAIAGALIYVAVLTRRVPKFTLLCGAGAVTILWSLLPRWQKWEDPGPRITEEEQPRLFAVIRDVAQRMEMEMPREVYLIPDVNAFVTERGSFLGFGGRRVMGIGLGLLAVDNVSQLRATLAHEFGHFKGGETRLSGFIYGTRRAMIRTLENLQASGSSLLHVPFDWMHRLFLRITQAVSRQQELVADEWSVRLEGKTAHVTGLRTEAAHGVGFSLFLENEVYPLGSLGVAPDNLFAGYRHFTGSHGWRKLQPSLEARLAEDPGSPYDSHPALEERVRFAEGLALPDKPMDTTPAFALLEGSENVEQRFSASIRPEHLQAVSWGELGTRWGELWGRTATRVQARVPEANFGNVVRLLKDAAQAEAFAEKVHPWLVAYKMPDRAEQVRDAVTQSVAPYLASLLAQRGFTWRTAPGEPIALVRGEEQVDPLKLVREVLEGKAGVEALERLRGADLSDAASWTASEDALEQARAPAAAVELHTGGHSTELWAELASLRLPQCCWTCLGPATLALTGTFTVGELGTVELQMASCEPHKGRVQDALEVCGYNQTTGRARLRVSDPEFAKLIQRVNA
jgi:Zn-dependent protease with chaperone function